MLAKFKVHHAGSTHERTGAFLVKLLPSGFVAMLLRDVLWQDVITDNVSYQKQSVCITLAVLPVRPHLTDTR